MQNLFLNRTENTEKPTFKRIPTDTNNFLHNKGVFKAGTYFHNPVHPSWYSDLVMGWTAKDSEVISRQGQDIPPL